jgi:hypothetical protein
MKRGSDGMFPGFYFVLHAWIAFAGGVDELITRAAGILFFGLGSAVLLRTLARLFSPLAAGWASLILLFSGGTNLIDLRAYNWLLGALALSFTLVLLWSQSARRSRLCLLNAPLQLFIWSLHPFACLYACAIGAGVVLAPGRWKERTLFAASYLPAALALYLWIPYLRHLSLLTQPWNWIPRPGWKDLAEFYFCVPLIITVLLAAGALTLAFSPRPAPTSDQPGQAPPALWISSLFICLIPLALWLYSQGPAVVALSRYCTPLLLAWASLAAALWSKLERARAPKLGIWALWAAAAVVFGLTLRDAFNPALSKKAQFLRELEGGQQEAAWVRPETPILIESVASFLPRDYYNLGKRSYGFLLNIPMARSGRDCLSASVEANMMLRMKESGQTNVVTLEEALALAQAKGRLYLVDDPRHHAFDPLKSALIQQGWKTRPLRELLEPIEGVTAILRELQAPSAPQP